MNRNEEFFEFEEEGETEYNPLEVRKRKFSPKDVNIDVKNISLYSIISRIKSGKINMNTEFQRRGNLWSRTQQSKFIESILLNLPLPSFFFDASFDDNWLVVDGLQRLSSIQNFIINEESFRLTGLEVLEELNGRRLNELPPYMIFKLEEVQISVCLLKPGTHKFVKYDVFSRINTGGLTLQPQEIRHALNQGNPVKYLNTFVYDDISKFKYRDEYVKYINIDDKRMAGREMILRYIAFARNNWKEYKPSLSRFLDDEMDAIHGFGQRERDYYYNQLWKVCEVLYQLLGKDSFSKSVVNTSFKKRLNKSLFEVWTSILSKKSDLQLEIIKNRKLEIIDKYKELIQSEKFNNAITKSTSSKKHVNYRFEMIEELLTKYK